jgi:quercetin dioxygenase-like cupin family protein
MILHHHDSRPVQVLPGLTRRTLAHGPTVMIVEFSLADGIDLPMHAHPHEQAGYIVSGRLRLTMGSTTCELTAGDTYHVLPNVQHGAHVIQSAVVVDAFTPPRQDYL